MVHFSNYHRHPTIDKSTNNYGKHARQANYCVSIIIVDPDLTSLIISVIALVTSFVVLIVVVILSILIAILYWKSKFLHNNT